MYVEWKFIRNAPQGLAAKLGRANRELWVKNFFPGLIVMLWLTSTASAVGQVGTKVWEFKDGGKYAFQRMKSSPALAPDGTIYFGAEVFLSGVPISFSDRPKGLLLALNPGGTLKWQYETPAGIVTSPTVGTDGAIYFFTDYYVRNNKGFTTLYALNADGSKRWEFETEYSAGGDPVAGPPALGSDGTIYAASTSAVLALKLDGALKWQYAASANSLKTGGFKPSLALGAGDVIYIATSDGYFMAVAPDGTALWETSAGTDLRSPPAIGADGTIYVGGAGGRIGNWFGGKLYAFNPNGSLKWEFVTGGRIDVSPVVAPDGTIYCGDLAGKLYALRHDGTLQWIYASDGMITSSPIIDSQGNIYFGSTLGSSGRVYALNPSGEKLWDTEIRFLSTAAVISNDGKLFVGSNNSTFSALQAGHPPAVSGWPMLQQNPQRTGRAPIPGPAAAGAELPKITMQPQSQSVSGGSDVSLTANVSSPTPLKFLWRFNGANLAGADHPTLVLTNVSLGQAGRYALIASNATGSASSISVALIVRPKLTVQATALELTGWNNDVVWENAATSSAFSFFVSGTVRVGERNGVSWVESGYEGRIDGLPLSRRIVSLVSSNVVFELQPYSSNNVLMLTSSATNHTGTLVLAKPARHSYLVVLAASGMAGGGVGQLVLNFADGTVSQPVSYVAEYWHERGPQRAIDGLIAQWNLSGSKSFTTGADTWGASLYQTDIDLTLLGLDRKPIKSITFIKPGFKGPPYTAGIFAVSGVVAPDGPRLDSPKRSADGSMEIRLTSPNNAANRVETSQDFIHWAPLPALIADGDGFRAIDLEATSYTHRFYRATVTP